MKRLMLILMACSVFGADTNTYVSSTNYLNVTNMFTYRPLYTFKTNELSFTKNGVDILRVTNVVFVYDNDRKDTNGFSFSMPILYFIPEKHWSNIVKALKEIEKE